MMNSSSRALINATKTFQNWQHGDGICPKIILKGSLEKLFKEIKKHATTTTNSFFLNIGCSYNYISWAAAAFLGCNAVGIENDSLKYASEENFGWALVQSSPEHGASLRKKVALFHLEPQQPVDWKGFDVFFLGGEVEDNQLPGIYNNLAYAMEEGKTYVLVIPTRSRLANEFVAMYVDVAKESTPIKLDVQEIGVAPRKTSRTVKILLIEKKRGVQQERYNIYNQSLLNASISFLAWMASNFPDPIAIANLCDTNGGGDLPSKRLIKAWDDRTNETNIDCAVSHVAKIHKKHELGCLHASEGLGGTYQTTRKGCLKKLFREIQNHTTITEDSFFVDIGCAHNCVSWIAAQVLGCNAVGIEIDELRVKAAANAALDLLTPSAQNIFPLNRNVAIFCVDASKAADWRGFDVFFLWEVAFPPTVLPGIYDNLAYAMEEDKTYVLVHSVRWLKDRYPLLVERVNVLAQGPKINLTFSCGAGASSLVQIFKIQKKVRVEINRDYLDQKSLKESYFAFMADPMEYYRLLAEQSQVNEITTRSKNRDNAVRAGLEDRVPPQTESFPLGVKTTSQIEDLSNKRSKLK